MAQWQRNVHKFKDRVENYKLLCLFDFLKRKFTNINFARKKMHFKIFVFHSRQT